MVKLKVYSQAFFDLALESGKLEEYKAQNDLVLSTLKKDENLSKILTHPEVSSEKKFSVLKELFSKKVNEDFLGLFNIVLKKRRENYLIEILEVFSQLVMKHKNISIAQVCTPVELSETQKEKIKTKLQGILGKEIILDVKIMPELVAGLRIIADGAVIDSSFKKQLAAIKQHMIASLNTATAKEVS